MRWVLGAVLVVPVAANQLGEGAWLGFAAAVAAMAVAVAAPPPVGLVVVVAGTVFDGNFVFAVPVLSYLAGLRTERVRPVVLVFAAITAGGTALNLALLRTGPAQWFLLVMMLLLIGVLPWLVGRYRRQQARLVSAGWERAARLEYERQILVRQAELRERARIAREMHDRLGHELALIALSAGALETAPDAPDRQRELARRVRESAASATDQLHDVIGVLRDGDDVPPVEAVVERARAAGMAVSLRRTGEPMPPAVERVAVPVVREALTNASKHAPGAATVVELTSGAVSVVNEAPAGPAPAAATGGTGLAGLADRVRLAGGVLTAGPAGDGFRVHATLPPGPEPGPDLPVAAELRNSRRRARWSLAVPIVLGVAAAVGYYAVATSGSVLSEADFDRMPVGAPRTELSLPPRQVLQPSPASRPGCEFYTDGNFPLADATYRLCFDAGRLVSKDRLP